MNASQTDRIEKSILIKAPRSRVWHALTDAKQFGEWFLAKLEGQFAVGTRISGTLAHPDCFGMAFEVEVERMEPEHRFAFRWHPDEEAMAQGFGVESTTLVEFGLEEADGGTQLTMVESGFDNLPPERRSKALRLNDSGWTEQLNNIAAYVER